MPIERTELIELTPDHFQYVIQDVDMLDEVSTIESNGLFRCVDGGLHVLCGTHTGVMTVEIRWWTSEPTLDDLETWDAVGEVTVPALTQLGLWQLMGGLEIVLADWPGHYRMRLSARQRDLAAEYNYRSRPPAARERHRIDIWRVGNDAMDPVVRKLDDATGRVHRKAP